MTTTERTIVLLRHDPDAVQALLRCPMRTNRERSRARSTPLYPRLLSAIHPKGPLGGAPLVLPPSDSTPYAFVVEASAEQVEALRATRPDLHIVRDRPLSLITSVPSGTVALDATALDGEAGRTHRWHLEALGVADRPLGLTGAGVSVGVLGPGIHAAHPELRGRVVSAWALGREGAPVEQAGAPGGAEGQDHGTHVAGLVAGRRVGAAPGAELLSLRMPQGARCTLADLILWLRWLGASGAVDIINISAVLSGDELSPEELLTLEAVFDDVRASGVLPVLAIGDEGPDRVRLPGALRNVVSVGACTRGGAVAAFSSSARIVRDGLQRDVPSLVAPGRQVISCVMGGGYEARDGTAVAAALTSGLAALLLERWPTLTLPELEAALAERCEHLALAPPPRQGAGMPRWR